MMKIEIDLSNRLEESGPTWVALANHHRYVIKIPSPVIQLGWAILKARHVPRKEVKPLLWTAILFLLLESHLERLSKQPVKIVIDNEYDGYQVTIKRELLRYIRLRFDTFPAHKIVIASVGKQSPAHDIAIKAKRKKMTSDKTITDQELLKLF